MKPFGFARMPLGSLISGKTFFIQKHFPPSELESALRLFLCLTLSVSLSSLLYRSLILCFLVEADWWDSSLGNIIVYSTRVHFLLYIDTMFFLILFFCGLLMSFLAPVSFHKKTCLISLYGTSIYPGASSSPVCICSCGLVCLSVAVVGDRGALVCIMCGIG